MVSTSTSVCAYGAICFQHDTKVVFLRNGVASEDCSASSTTKGACITARRLLCFSGSNVDCELISCTSSTVRSRLCSTTARPGLTQKEITLPGEGQLKEPASTANSGMPSLMFFHIPKSSQLRVYIPKPSCQFTHVANHKGSSSGCAASRLFSTTAQDVPAGCAAKFLYRYSEQRPPVRLMWHRMSLPGPALCDRFP